MNLLRLKLEKLTDAKIFVLENAFKLQREKFLPQSTTSK
jgi:hypothetical protein